LKPVPKTTIMKRILLGALLLSSASLFAQDDHRQDGDNNRVPDNVQRSFQREYPNAQNPQWQNTNGQWHSTYRDKDNREAESYYNLDGRRIDTHYSYNNNDLPPRVRERADRRYQSNYLAYRVERPNAQPLFQIRIGDNDRANYYDENGRKRRYRDRH
jgi:hypothetical protein